MSNKILAQPAGYAITVTSWENDGDFRATKTAYVKTEEHARILTTFAKLFVSYYTNNTVRGETSFDNMYDPNDSERSALYRATAAIIGDSDYFKVVYDWDDLTIPDQADFDNYDSDKDYEGTSPMDAMCDTTYELLDSLGLAGQQDEQWTRVAESIKVLYYPEDVYVEDVTSTFI